MPQSKIKPEHAKKYVAFGKQTGNLGERDDIDELAIIAHESGDKSILDLFESAPSLEELKKARTDAQLNKHAAIGVKPAPAPVQQPATAAVKPAQ